MYMQTQSHVHTHTYHDQDVTRRQGAVLICLQPPETHVDLALCHGSVGATRILNHVREAVVHLSMRVFIICLLFFMRVFVHLSMRD